MEWRGHTDSKMTELDVKMDNMYKRIQGEMNAAKSTRNEMFDQLRELNHRMAFTEGRLSQDGREPTSGRHRAS